MAMSREEQTNEPLDILFQDNCLVAINKPSGLLVHRSPIDKHETRFALQLLRDQIGQRVYPCHRLDKPTSGILLFALDEETQRCINTQFETHCVTKIYQAVVRGHTPSEGAIDHPLKIMQDFRSQAPKAIAQDALTRFKTEEHFELPIACGRYSSSRYSLITLMPTTGRKHQLRRHMKHLSHPIIGDTTHGNGAHNRLFRQHLKTSRLMLHASALVLKHPLTGEALEIDSTLPGDFARALNHLHAKAVYATS